MNKHFVFGHENMTMRKDKKQALKKGLLFL